MGCTCDTPTGSESRNCSYCRGFDSVPTPKPKKMGRKEARAKLEKLRAEESKLQAFLDKTCRHPNQKTEETSGGYDYFKHYETTCKDCHKVLRRS